MNTIFKTTALAFATSSLLLAGCGGSSGGGNTTPQVKKEVLGVDFYLKNATITFDNCPSSMPTKTNDVGIGEYALNCVNSGLTVTGGIDIGTGLQFQGVLKAPRSNPGALSIVSSLTTLIANNPNAATKLANKLGLKEVDILTVDPMTNAQLLKQTVVVQQFIDQIQKTLSQLSINTNGSITAQQAATAASTALSESIVASSGTTVDLTNVSLAESAVAGAILNAASANPSSLPFSGKALSDLADNTAAVAAATIAQKVTEVNSIAYIAVPNATEASLKAAYGTKLDNIKATSTSPAASNLINALANALKTPGVSTAALRALGNAVATNANAIASTLAQVNTSLPPTSQIPSTIVADLQQLELYSNYLQLDSLGLNGGTPYDIATVENSIASGKELSVNGPLNNVQVKLNKVGTPFDNNASEARIGLSYTIGANQLDLIIDSVSLTFNGNGTLIAASIPQNTTYSFRTSGAVNASGTTVSKQSAEALTVTNGSVNLPIDVFLQKVTSSSGATAAQIDSYRPKSGNIVNMKVALGRTINTKVRVGTGTGNTAKAARSISITANDSTTNPIVLNGQGANGTISVK